MNIEIVKPKIFPNKIIAGVTKINKKFNHTTGLSFTKSNHISKNTAIKNRKLFAEQLEIKYENLKFQKQIHSDIIRIINNESEEIESDAMITNQKGIIINILIADCIAVLLYDSDHNIVAGIHSGWRGSKQKITTKTIKTLINKFNSNPKNIKAFISPCASGYKYEIKSDVARYFPNYIIKIGNEKYLFDNRKFVLDELINSGLLLKNIEISDICTITNSDYHSYRRDKELSGRAIAFIGIK